MKYLILITTFLLQSCASAQATDVYRKIVDDIKNSKKYEDFTNQSKQKCKGLFVSKYKYSVCSFGSFFKNEEIKAFIDNECSEEETFKTEKSNVLNKLSDKGETCFIADFSFKVKDKIAVKIISKSDENKIGYESLHFLYDVSNNQAQRLEIIEVTND
ncbi:MAG: hypothetical protein GKR88_16980 [Flavobacteriaceae bacterium]|nr:MAG: hypothetical protein GKR88_16960 [Flavobacteriaceae bacterium]QMU65800.1 MAG: hypothetical protein GKR88_16980 [Flavobacteriaceae bacterium]